MSFCDKSITYNLSKHPDLKATTLLERDTVTLQREESSKASSTFTSYDYDYDSSPTTSAKSQPLALLFKPIHEEELREHATHNLTHPSLAAQEEDVSLVQLSEELDAHFQSLKREFEIKRGKSWTPL
ncbi:hypothetical protein G6011_06649 [Alternaria panax]|uniref:Uncharacterized protein n=1 Tax=Alternaria panax TaxID=48097 RepID=A0AAD4FJT7_9PLEO|nr:hypothetical protein G6011_06649 [Alternaria panax]